MGKFIFNNIKYLNRLQKQNSQQLISNPSECFIVLMGKKHKVCISNLVARTLNRKQCGCWVSTQIFAMHVHTDRARCLQSKCSLTKDAHFEQTVSIKLHSWPNANLSICCVFQIFCAKINLNNNIRVHKPSYKFKKKYQHLLEFLTQAALIKPGFVIFFMKYLTMHLDMCSLLRRIERCCSTYSTSPSRDLCWRSTEASGPESCLPSRVWGLLQSSGRCGQRSALCRGGHHQRAGIFRHVFHHSCQQQPDHRSWFSHEGVPQREPHLQGETGRGPVWRSTFFSPVCLK